VRQAQLVRDSQVIRQLYELDRLVVAQIAGPCMGAGLSLALACDLRVAATNASFGAVFHRIGLTGDFGLLWLLPRVVGPARAAQLLYEAEVFDGSRAAALDLVHHAVEPAILPERTRALCERLCQGPPLAQALTKRGLRRAAALDLDAMLEWEAHAQSILSKTADASEGVAAFLEKRKAEFAGS
jgi:2-(1,2-epoxy-1,2-dihydrophenyl)acetyl-CoA isomerase